MKPSKPDRVFDIINYSILAIVLFVLMYPLYFVVISSISDPALVNTGKITWYPRGLNFDGYEKVFSDRSLLSGYRNTFLYTGVGILVNVSITLLAGYALSRKDLRGRSLISKLMVFTMLFQGGLIPLYIVVKKLGLLDTFMAMILPTAVAVWNVIVARTYFQTTIPDELLDASRVDGCTNRRFFFSIVLPTSQALIAVQVLFYGVFHWNSFFQALIFLYDPDRYPLQLVLREILIRQQMSQMMQTTDPRELAELEILAELIKYAAIIVSSIPILLLYPFVQRYFVSGIMIGAIKG
jgi:putative aldouronate transport system permease protein